MPRAIDGTRRLQRRKKILKHAKGFRGRRSNLFKTAKNAVAKALQTAYEHRRLRRRDFRSLWITRISAECRNLGISYSKFISGLNKAGIIINRKALSNMAIEDKAAFAALVAKAKQV
ncbi:MAG: 50S ribosomal protein L20 [Spirochaetaceae bacterium]|nr:50S ribosomal protein L20 [Spirochaetaceae bacterium]